MRRTATVLAFVGLSILAACVRDNHERVRPITEAERLPALGAVQDLRQNYNHSPCDNLLGREELRSGWTQSCDHIREDWGQWQRFDAKYWYRAGRDAIAVEGVAGFAKGNCTVQLIWDLVTGSPHMAAFFLQSKDGDEFFPPRPPRFMDPPPVPGKAWHPNA